MKNSPQTENGFFKIATGKPDNDILMALISAKLSAPEYAVVLFIIRKTWGWHKKADAIGRQQFTDASGLSRRAVSYALESLEKKGIILRKNMGTKPTIYQFNKQFKDWQLGQRSALGQHNALASLGQTTVVTRAKSGIQLGQGLAPTKDTTKDTTQKIGAKAPTPKATMLDFIASVETNGEQFATVVCGLEDKGIPNDIAEQEIRRFVAYWTEPNHSGTKQRWQLEKTFEVGRRLTTWFSKINSFRGQPREKKGIAL